MNKKEILLCLSDTLSGCNRSKGIRYLFHLVENSNREFSYIALFQAVNNKDFKAESNLLACSQIKQCDAKAIKEVYRQIFKINGLISIGDSNDAIVTEKKLLENYLHEVVDNKYIKYFHDEFTKCRKGIKEVVRLGLKRLYKDQPDLKEIVKQSLVQRWNSIGFYI